MSEVMNVGQSNSPELQLVGSGQNVGGEAREEGDQPGDIEGGGDVVAVPSQRVTWTLVCLF